MKIDFTKSLNLKEFFRFTGPPENWLTAVKFMTWGLEEKHKKQWENIQTGDIFFIHSTGSSSSLFKNAKSGIIGLGVVGSNFQIKDNFLWIREFVEHTNKWPLLVPFSEVYLFSSLPSADSWQAPSPDNTDEVKQLINLLLQNYIPLSKITSFPQMGSFSHVKKEVANQILFDKRPLFLYSNKNIEKETPRTRRTKLMPVKDVSETFRYAKTLQLIRSINKRVIKEKSGTYTKDNELLSKAEEKHSTIIQNLLDLLRGRGYETMSNQHVDLFAFNENRSFLFEVKSVENRNFRTQARKGIIQLFEYDFFEIHKFINDKNLKFDERYKVLIPSHYPKDENYISFINELKIGIGVVEKEKINPIGTDFGFSKL